jgi:hypothetical protein
MQIIDIPIKSLHPYKNNPRNNAEAVDYVANSIRDFGFKVPLVIDSDNVIVCGHTRYLAAKKLGLKTVPCIIADDLTDEQIKAFRLADNKVAEKATWDKDLLNIELGDIINFNMSDFGFDFSIDSAENESLDNEPTEFHRDKTLKSYNLAMFDVDRCSGFYQMPIIAREDFIPDDLIGFNYMLTAKDKRCGIHCFVDDYQFERLWTSPEKYVNPLLKYECFLSPDFSLYLDMPIAMKVWNIYRSRLIGQYMQDCGCVVIPTISWAEPATFDFAFDGIETGSVVAVSTVGVKRQENSFDIWKTGMDEMIRRIMPSAILLYGGEVEYDHHGIKTVCYDNHVTEKFKSKDVK